MRTSPNKKLYLFFGIIFLIGLVLGIIFLIYLDEASKEVILLNINEWLENLENSHINNIVPHIVILSTLLIISLFIVGIPILLFFLFYNGFSIGFAIISLINIFGIKGLLYGIIYVIITKGIFLFFFIIFTGSLIKIAMMFLLKIFKNKKINNDSLAIYLKRIFICMVAIILSDIILYFGGVKLISIFNFLLF